MTTIGITLQNGGNFTRNSADMTENFNYYYSMILENFFNYNKKFGDHLIGATLGNTYNPSNMYRSVAVGGSNYTSTEIKNVALANSNSEHNDFYKYNQHDQNRITLIYHC